MYASHSAINGAYLYDCGPQLPATADGIDAEKKLRKGIIISIHIIRHVRAMLTNCICCVCACSFVDGDE